MLTINKLIPQGRGLAPVLVRRAATVELDWDTRARSRFGTTDSAGRRIAVFLARGTVVRGGDVLVVEDGTFVLVKAAPQAVLVVRACAEHGTPRDLLRAAYHLGNRHVQLELREDHLKLEADPVLAQMLRRRHLIVSEASEPFEPEAGAYEASAAPHGHHDHDPHGHEGHGGHGHHGHGDGHDHHGHQHHGHDHHGHDHHGHEHHGHEHHGHEPSGHEDRGHDHHGHDDGHHEPR